MASEPLESLEPIAASEAEMPVARKSSKRLKAYAKRGVPLKVVTVGRSGDEAVVLPASAVRVLAQVLMEMAAGNAVTLMPVHAELTTQKAADLLGVSRPFIIKQMDEGRLAYRKVGTHRRVTFKDLMDYKRRMDAGRLKALEDLAAEAQELGLGY